MPKTPEELMADPKAAAKAVSEKPSDAHIAELASKVADHLGKSMGEQFEAYAKQLSEHAKAAVEGKPENAPAADGNVYAAKTAADWLKEMGVNKAAEENTGDEPESLYKAFCDGIAYRLCNGNDSHRGMDAAVKAKALGKYEGVVAKALGVDDFSAGGALFQEQMADEIVGALLSETGVWGDPMIRRYQVDGQMPFPYEVTPPTVRHVAENAAINASESAYDQVVLRPEALGVVVPVSRKLMRSVPAMSQEVDRTMRRRFDERLDEKLIRGDGTVNTQTGLRYLADSSNVLTQTAAVTPAGVENDLFRMQQTMTANDVPWTPATSGILFSPRTWKYLFALRGQDAHLFKQEMIMGNLAGVPISGMSKRGITNIPENLSVTNSNESEVILYEKSGLRLGIGSDLMVQSTDTGAYNDSSGSVQSAMSRMQMVYMLAAEIGLVEVYRGLGIVVISDCSWGS